MVKRKNGERGEVFGSHENDYRERGV